MTGGLPVLPGQGTVMTSTSLVRRLLALCWRYRGTTIRALLLQVLSLALTVLGLAITGGVVDLVRFRMESETKLIGWVQSLGLQTRSLFEVLSGGALLVLAVGVCSALLDYATVTTKAHLVNVQVVPRLRAELFRRMQRLDAAFFDKYQSGELVARITRDVQGLRLFISGIVIQGSILVLSLVVFLAYMLATHVTLTLVGLAAVPLLALITRAFSRWVQPAYLKSRQLNDRVLKSISEGVRGILVTRLFGRERERQERFEAACRDVQAQQLRIFGRVCRLTFTVEAVGQLNVVVTMVYGAWLVVQGELSLGELVVFAGLLHQFAGRVADTASIANSLQQSLAGARRVFGVLDAPVLVKSPPNAVVPGRLQGSVALVGVTFGYPGADPVLKGVDLEIPAGTCLGILGPPGAGKSTLLSLISRFREPESGRVLVDGVDVRNYELDALRQQIGVVFQETLLFRDTIAANIAFGHPDASRERIEVAARIAGAHGFISKLADGFDTLVEEGGRNLSGGQRQRIAIARAILTDPRILILDDPTTAVDVKVETQVLEALAEARRGRTTVVVSSKLSTLRFADKIVRLADGKMGEYVHEPPADAAEDDVRPIGESSRAVLVDTSSAADTSQHGQEASEPGSHGYSWELVRRCLAYVSRFPKERNGVMLLSLLRIFLMPGLTWLAASVLSGPVAKGSFEAAVPYFVAYLVLSVLAAAVLGYRTLWSLNLGERVVFALRSDVHRRLMSMPLGYFDRTPVGRLVSQVANDVDVVRGGIQEVLFVVVVQGGTGIVAAGLMFYSDPLLAALALLFVPCLGYTLSKLAPRLIRSYRAVQEQTSRVTSVLMEAISGVSVIQSFVRNRHNERRFGSLLSEQSATTMDAARHQARLSPMLHAHGQLFLATLLVVTGVRARLGDPGVTAIIQFMFLAPLFFGPLYALSAQYNALLSAMAGAERIFGILDAPRYRTAPDGQHAVKALAGHIEFRDVSFAYDTRREVVRGVSFEATPGQTVALVGETGSGKTTILRLLSKLYVPSSGQILVDGRNLRELSSESYRWHCRAVPQDSFLFSGSILENLRWGKSDVTEQEARRTFETLGVLDLIDRLPKGLNTEAGEGGRALSAGERQIVCFARALLANPRILVLDEATSSMDAETEARLRGALGDLARGRTCFIAAHRLRTVEQADLILVVDDGQIVEQGTHDDLIRLGGHYARLLRYWQSALPRIADPRNNGMRSGLGAS